MFVASDGYIVDIIDLYLADGKNNDANILNNTLLNNGTLQNWLRKDYFSLCFNLTEVLEIR